MPWILFAWFLVFLLKVLGAISLSWIVVILFPLIVMAGIFFVGALFVVLTVLVAGLFGSRP